MINEEGRSIIGSAATRTDVRTAIDLEDDERLEPAFSLLAVSGNPGHAVAAIADSRLGSGDQEHGEALLRIFLEGLCDRVTQPDEVVFYDKGVLLLEKGHWAEDILNQLCLHDVQVKACRESLDYYKKEPAASKIQPVPMSEITRDMLRSDRVIRP